MTAKFMMKTWPTQGLESSYSFPGIYAKTVIVLLELFRKSSDEQDIPC